MNKKTVFIVLSIIAVAGLAGLAVGRYGGRGETFRPSGKLQVTASFYPLYFFASRIGGDRVEITNLTPAGAEPHDYEPTATGRARIERSGLLILNGAGLEPWAENVTKNLDGKSTVIVRASEGLTTGSDGDPHVWLSPILAGRMADKILQGFIAADPANGNYYRANADRLKTELFGLDQAYRQELADCAEKNIITSHAAFSYLAAAYGLKQVAIAGLSPDAEPSPKQLSDIAKFAKDNNIKYIFFESLLSPKLSQTIANEIGAQTLVLNPLEGLSADELAQGKNYLTEMQNNLINLRTALQCK